jgi:hypothetical protein
MVSVPQKLPFLEAVCWQTENPYRLSPEEMLCRYERGWRYRGVVADLEEEERQFVQNLGQRYGSWISMEFQQDQHQRILTALNLLNSEFLEACRAFFGGGTLLALKYEEYRVSQDIDFLCADSSGYRRLRDGIYEQGYAALFLSQEGIGLPRSIQTDQYAVRFPVVIDGASIRFEIVREARISLDPPERLSFLPVACLNTADSFAEKLMANADRWLDASVESRDLIDLAMLRLHSPIPESAITKATDAYPVIGPLQRAITTFQNKPDYRERCYQSLQVRSPQMIADGLDQLASDFGLPAMERISVEQRQS